MMVVLGRMIALTTTVIVTRGGLERRLMGSLISCDRDEGWSREEFDGYSDDGYDEDARL